MSYIPEIEKELNTILDRNKILFIALVCRKMLPHYILFSEKEGWGDIEILEKAINLMFKSAINGFEEHKYEAEKLSESIDEICPDLDDFEGIASYALDTCIAIDEALRFIISEDKENINNAFTSVFDTVDMFIQVVEDLDPNDENLDNIILNNPIMIREIKRQNDILRAVKDLKVISTELIENLKNEDDKRGEIINLKDLY
jgi:uncharacterized protein